MFSRAVSGVIMTYILINNITKHQETLLVCLVLFGSRNGFELK